ncbi:MAG TPA: hypothetical protein VL966_12760 [Alphaproteobacteria bacterium]|nr:hypothetical protein [Alphaproteobacteria bacterium]
MGTTAMHDGVSRAAMLVAAALVAMLSLNGCAAPAALTVASVAADGASLAASGKTMTDHAMSAVSGQDCSTANFFDNGVLCRAKVPEANAEVVDAPPPLAQPAPRAPLPPIPDNSEATFLALGEFADWANADNAVVTGRFYSPIVVPLDKAEGDKGSSFWVIAGQPLRGGAEVPVAQAKSIGFAGARTIALCRATYRPAPCAEEAAPVETVAVTKPATRNIPPQLAQRPDAR